MMVEQHSKLKLDDLYKMTSFIYHDSNLGRSREATLMHFVEVCGMLTLLDRKKKRDKIDIPGALCKALGWYFPLLAKMRVESVEHLIFTKYPGVCPYCRGKPHIERECKLVKGTENVLAHDEVEALTVKNWAGRPAGLNDWQRMFNEIYPRNLNATGFSTIALLEEIGELSEAVRVFDRYPHYFYGEAADVFSYIMGLANEYEIQCSERDETFNFELEFLSRYPGLCIACGARVCTCPTVPSATVGRMAKEMPVNIPMISDVNAFDAAGREVSKRVLESIGQVPGLAKYLPYDRGDMNAGLMQLAFRLAHALEQDHKETADRLRSIAIDLGNEKRSGGTIAHSLTFDVLDLLKEAWLKVDPSVKTEIESDQHEIGALSHLLNIRILVVTSNTRGGNALLRLDKEINTIKQRIKIGTSRERIQIEIMTATTVDNFRVELLSNNYDVIHFAGHANEDGLEFMSDDGTHTIPYSALAKMVSVQQNLKCVLLNACSSMTTLNVAFAPLVIGMIDTIDDDEAIEFAKGFYDAVASGRTPEQAFDVGAVALEAAEFNSHLVAKLTGVVAA